MTTLVPDGKITYFEQLALICPMKATGLVQEAFNIVKQEALYTKNSETMVWACYCCEKSGREKQLLDRLSKKGQEVANLRRQLGSRRRR